MGSFGKTVKPAGSGAWGTGSRKIHGQVSTRKLAKLSGNMARKDEKPRGFLSRKDKPATGRRKNGK